MGSLADSPSRLQCGIRPIDPELFQSPSYNRPRGSTCDGSGGHSDDDLSLIEGSIQLRSTSTPPTSSPAPPRAAIAREKDKEETVLDARRAHIAHCQLLMNRRFQPYKRRKAPPPVELRFAMKSLGRSSSTDVQFEDAIEGEHLFRRGLSLLSPTLIRKAYTAKLAAKECVLSRIKTTLVELHAMEKQSEFLRAIKEEHEDELSVAFEELRCVQDVIVERGIDIDDHIEFNHAAYVEELVTLATTDLQFHQLSSVHATLPPSPAGDTDVTSPSDDAYSDPETLGLEVDSAELDLYDDVKYDP